MTTDVCNPIRSVPIIHFHSYLDTNIPYQGGIGEGLSNHYNPPLDSIFTLWSIQDSCILVNDTITHDAHYTYVNWTECSCETEISYYITQDGGHSWPGGNQTIFGDAVSEFINATDLMWSFFLNHTLSCSPSSISDDFPNNKPINVFPNPTSGILKIRTDMNTQNLEISIYNISGERILLFNKQSEINIKHLNKGIYFVKVIGDGFVKTEKVIKVE